jgi:6-phosphofructokinase 1
MRKKLAILVGGGPAPGINSVIGAATIRSVLEGVDVLGIEDGFEWVMQGNVEHVRELDIESVSRIHFRGGSVLGIARANPTKDPQLLENAVRALLRLNVAQLVTIGGDDTAYSAMKLEEKAAGRIRVVHVPKTIDNDLDLPAAVDTFGFQTARHVGAEIVKNLMVDAHTTSKWYFVITMGRKAGHLALGIGKAAGATLTLIPEEFANDVPFKAVVDTLVGAIVKRQSLGQRHGVAVIAEGVIEVIRAQDLAQIEEIERDAHGHPRLSEVDFGEILKRAVQDRLKQLKLTPNVIAKNIGYELRCADPTPYDMEYTRDLGYCAAKYLLDGGHAAMVSMQGGNFVPVPFAQMLDPVTGRTRVRMVDIGSTRYAIARRYMIRLRRDDFEDPHELAKFAATAGLSLPEFREQFEYLVEGEPPPLDFAPLAPAS